MGILIKCDECGRELKSFENVSAFGLTIWFPTMTHGKMTRKRVVLESKGCCEYCSKPLTDAYINEKEMEKKVKAIISKMFKLKTFRKVN